MSNNSKAYESYQKYYYGLPRTYSVQVRWNADTLSRCVYLLHGDQYQLVEGQEVDGSKTKQYKFRCKDHGTFKATASQAATSALIGKLCPDCADPNKKKEKKEKKARRTIKRITKRNNTDNNDHDQTKLSG